ncbi:pgal-1 [Pristionchus pacificus]|uniref:peptidylamidoglycolate lyase n=1 Tax=Pristionchus pacificus TaxID=54126 RepID=A0A2A6BLD7_PRIPA|nr:pgal-1 [Pristionchus pacificus]|eukprot:PDM66719.1 pgal-1 [Pristionchus pacificus]
MPRALLFLLLLVALLGWAAGQYLENQEYDVDENGLPMDSGNVETNDEDQTLVDKREDEEDKPLQYDERMEKLMRAIIGNQEAKARQETLEDDNEEVEKAKRAPLVPEQAFLMSTSKPLGEISGMAMDKKGRLVVFHRADRVWDESTFDESNRLSDSLKPIVNSTIAIINATTGQVHDVVPGHRIGTIMVPGSGFVQPWFRPGSVLVLEEHGENLFYLPHGLSIDGEGNIWVTDVGSHQVHKLGSDYKPVLTLGEKLVPGTDGDHFCQPTDVAVAKNGIFFVADGYCNSRVVKYDKNGNVLAVFEAPDDQLGSSPFLIPHSLALIEDLNLLCVADRENERVQCYSSGLAEGHRSIPAGIPITSAENIGRVYAIREKNHYLVGVTGADGDGTLDPQLFTMDMETGKANTFLKGIENAHALAISDDGKVYVGQMTPNQIVVVDLA